MNGQPSEGSGRLGSFDLPAGGRYGGPPSEDWSWLNTVADRFEEAWKAGSMPRIEDYFAATTEPQRDRLLQHLVRVELELRRQAGEELKARLHPSTAAAGAAHPDEQWERVASELRSYPRFAAAVLGGGLMMPSWLAFWRMNVPSRSADRVRQAMRDFPIVRECVESVRDALGLGGGEGFGLISLPNHGFCPELELSRDFLSGLAHRVLDLEALVKQALRRAGTNWSQVQAGAKRAGGVAAGNPGRRPDRSGQSPRVALHWAERGDGGLGSADRRHLGPRYYPRLRSIDVAPGSVKQPARHPGRALRRLRVARHARPGWFRYDYRASHLSLDRVVA